MNATKLALSFIVSIAKVPEVALTTPSPHGGALVPPRHAAAYAALRAEAVAPMLRALNAARVANGLRELALDPGLCSIASAHAIDMAERNYFSHRSPDGASPNDRMKRARLRFHYAGENLALDRSASAASNALWKSREHRRNVLGRHYKKVGIAAVRSAAGTIFVEDFSD